jgi:hypothetical protein
MKDSNVAEFLENSEFLSAYTIVGTKIRELEEMLGKLLT